MPQTLRLLDGSIIEIIGYGSSHGGQEEDEDEPHYIGTITRNIRLTVDEYYDVLKFNNLPIPLDLLRPGDPGFDTKDYAIETDYIDTIKYVLKDGTNLYISNRCMKTDPCKHYGVMDGKKWCQDGPGIKKLLVDNEITDLGHFSRY